MKRISKGIILLAFFTVTACGNKVAVQHPDNQPRFNYPVTIDNKNNDEASK